MRSIKEVKKFANDMINYALTKTSKEELANNQPLIMRMKETTMQYAMGAKCIGVRMMIDQYINFNKETFEDLVMMAITSHGTLNELFDCVIEHRDLNMLKEFDNYITSKRFIQDLGYREDKADEIVKTWGPRIGDASIELLP